MFETEWHLDLPFTSTTRMKHMHIGHIVDMPDVAISIAAIMIMFDK